MWQQQSSWGTLQWSVCHVCPSLCACVVVCVIWLCVHVCVYVYVSVRACIHVCVLKMMWPTQPEDCLFVDSSWQLPACHIAFMAFKEKSEAYRDFPLAFPPCALHYRETSRGWGAQQQEWEGSGCRGDSSVKTKENQEPKLLNCISMLPVVAQSLLIIIINKSVWIYRVHCNVEAL